MSVEYLDLIYCLSKNKQKFCVASPLHIQEALRLTIVSEVFSEEFVLPLVEEELSVTGERMGTRYW